MAITKINPRTIHLGGPLTVVAGDDSDGLGTHVASAAITPGMLVEQHADSGDLKWRPHGTDSEQVTLAVALNEPHLNHGIDTAYAIGDLVSVGFLGPGSVFYGIIPSGQDISVGEFLQSNGDGKLKTASATTATANVAKFQSLDAPGSVTADTRLRVQVIQ